MELNTNRLFYKNKAQKCVRSLLNANKITYIYTTPLTGVYLRKLPIEFSNEFQKISSV